MIQLWDYEGPLGEACGGREESWRQALADSERLRREEEGLAKETQKNQTQSRRQAKNVGVMETKKNALGGRDRV